MTDIKEIIQGMYAIKTYLASKAIEEHGPARESLIGMQKVVGSAVNLLKEQEAMEPIEEFRKGSNCHVYHCKRCGNIVGTIFGDKRPIAKLCIEHFCDVCGQAVKWE